MRSTSDTYGFVRCIPKVDIIRCSYTLTYVLYCSLQMILIYLWSICTKWFVVEVKFCSWVWMYLTAWKRLMLHRIPGMPSSNSGVEICTSRSHVYEGVIVGPHTLLLEFIFPKVLLIWILFVSEIHNQLWSFGGFVNAFNQLELMFASWGLVIGLMKFTFFVISDMIYRATPAEDNQSWPLAGAGLI